MAHHVSFTFHKGHPSLESRAEKVASSILAETFVLFLRTFFLCVLVRYLARFSGFLVDGWMDGITKGRLTGKERKLVGFDARLKERGGKETVGEGSFV